MKTTDKRDEVLRNAAPALLAALEALMEFWDNGTPVRPGAEVVEDARRAITLATTVIEQTTFSFD